MTHIHYFISVLCAIKHFGANICENGTFFKYWKIEHVLFLYPSINQIITKSLLLLISTLRRSVTKRNEYCNKNLKYFIRPIIKICFLLTMIRSVNIYGVVLWIFTEKSRQWCDPCLPQRLVLSPECYTHYDTKGGNQSKRK